MALLCLQIIMVSTLSESPFPTLNSHMIGYDLNESLGDYVYGAAAEPNQDDNSHLLFEPDFGQASTFHTLDQNDSDVEARESNDESDRSVESGDSGQSGQVDESDDSGDSNDSGQSDESDDSSDSGESDGSDDENQNTNGQDQYDESVYDQDTDEEVESEQDVFESSQGKFNIVFLYEYCLMFNRVQSRHPATLRI
jgi:DNA mismatch repair ATPase MutL